MKRRLAHVFDSERAWKVYAFLIVALIMAVLLAIALWVRHSAPCWVFPLAEAPTRCLVVMPR